MDRLVKFVGNGSPIIINPKYVVALRPYLWRGDMITTTSVYVRGVVDGDMLYYNVAGTTEQVAEALGFELVTFSPATWLSDGSREGVE